jgi:uncharacterized repeat protein (TIGR02543 family)
MPAGNVTVTANYAAINYTVTVNGANGSQSASAPGGNFNVGETVTLSATPSTGYTFNGWTVNIGGVTISNNSFTMPAGNVTVTANYVIDSSGPLGDSDGDGVINQDDNFPNDPNRASGNDKDNDGIDDEFDTSYAVSITSSNGSVTGSGQKTVGSTVTLTATPDSGYTFSGWTVNSGGVTISNNSFTMPAGNVTVTANYTAIDYTVTIINGSNGANGTHSASAPGGDFNAGETVTLSATPSTGYVFSSWIAQHPPVTETSGIRFSSSLDPNATFTMLSSNVVISVNYTAIDYTVTVNGSNGTQSASASGGDFNVGETVTLSATPNAGYTFSSWTVNNGGVTISNNSFTMPAGNVTVTANYTAIDYTVTVNGANGAQSASAPGGDFNVGETVTLSATPNAGYTFSGWTVNNGGVTISNNSFTMPAGNVTVTANYTAIDYTVTVNGTNGEPMATVPGGNFNVGETVSIQGHEDSGYYFVSWTVNSGGVTLADPTSNYTTFTMPANNVEITASYAPLDYGVTLYSSFTENNWTADGTQTASAPGGNFNIGETVTISATPNAGFEFSSWTVDFGGITLSSTTNASTTFTMPANNVAITANYERIGYLLTLDGVNGTEIGGGTYYPEGEIVTVTATPDEGYEFSDWTVNSPSNLTVEIESEWMKIAEDIYGEVPNGVTGSSVSLSSDGTIVAIGGHGESGAIGSVRIYQNNSGVWVKMGQDLDEESSGDQFGKSVSLSADGTIVAVGAPLRDANYKSNNGEVYVYQYDNASNLWVKIGQDLYGYRNNDQFGRSVSLSADGTILAVGAPYYDATYTVDSGLVRVYEYSNNQWVQSADLEGEGYDFIGWSVSLSSDGTVVAIGSNESNSTGLTKIFENISGNWTQRGHKISGERLSDKSGRSVSLNADGTIVAVGAPYNDGGGGTSGHTRVFEWREYTQNDQGSYFYGGNWPMTQDATQPKPVLVIKSGTNPTVGSYYWFQMGTDIDGSAGDYSGTSVSLSSDGKTVVIGEYSLDTTQSDAGRVRIFGYDTISKSWTQATEDIYVEDTNNLPGRGSSVSISSDGATVAIGAYYNNSLDGAITKVGQTSIYNFTISNTASFTMPGENVSITANYV